MLNNQKQSEAARNIFGSSLIGLANTLAVVCTFLVTPTLYGRTIDWVQRYTALNYGYGWEDLVSFAWLLVCIALVFFISRASISTALIAGGLALMSRLF